MAVKIQTEIGWLTAVIIEPDPEFKHKEWTGYLKDLPEVVSQAGSANEVFNQLNKSLEIFMEISEETACLALNKLLHDTGVRKIRSSFI